MFLVTLLLGMCVVLKLAAVVCAIQWIARHGAAYRGRIAALEKDSPTPTRDAYQKAFLASEPWFFPFGAKDYWLDELVVRWRTGSRGRRLLSRLLAFFSRVLFSYPPLACACTLYLIILPGAELWMREAPLSPTHVCVAYVLSLLLLLLNMAIAVEALFGYTTIGSYGRYFHMFRPIALRSPFRTEVGIAGAIAGVMLVTSAAACYTAHAHFEAFKGEALLHYDPAQPVNWIGVYLQFVYFALVTLSTVGYGDITPANPWGQLTASVLLLQNTLFLLVVLSTLFSAIKAGPDTHAAARQIGECEGQ